MLPALHVPNNNFSIRRKEGREFFQRLKTMAGYQNRIKPLSVTTNVVGLQTDDADHVDQNSSAHVARVVGLQTDAVVVTETHLSLPLLFYYF